MAQIKFANVIARYKFNQNTYENFIPKFNSKFNDYTYTDETDTDGYIIRTIGNDSGDLPTFIRFGYTSGGITTKQASSLLSVEYINTSNITFTSNMFSDCTSLTSLDLSNFNTSKVTTMYAMFNNCTSLTSLDLSNFNTSKVTDFTNIFANTPKLTNIGLLYASASTINSLSSNMGTNIARIIWYQDADATELNRVINIETKLYKTNILTVNEDVELRGIGEVKDELNLVTGELNQYVGQTICTDGSAFYVNNTYNVTEEKTIGFRARAAIQDIKQKNGQALVFNSLSGSVGANSDNPGVSYQWHSLIIRVNKGDLPTLDIAGLDTYLKERPLIVQYELATEVVKTVDLTIVDQDNQPTELGTFENVTHVSLEAENLIPEVEMEVATIISEELASASPLMDDISNEQQQLETTVDEQSENVDATMIATTEIYEEIL